MGDKYVMKCIDIAYGRVKESYFDPEYDWKTTPPEMMLKTPVVGIGNTILYFFMKTKISSGLFNSRSEDVKRWISTFAGMKYVQHADIGKRYIAAMKKQKGKIGPKQLAEEVTAAATRLIERMSKKTGAPVGSWLQQNQISGIVWKFLSYATRKKLS